VEVREGRWRRLSGGERTQKEGGVLRRAGSSALNTILFQPCMMFQDALDTDESSSSSSSLLCMLSCREKLDSLLSRMQLDSQANTCAPERGGSPSDDYMYSWPRRCLSARLGPASSLPAPLLARGPESVAESLLHLFGSEGSADEVLECAPPRGDPSTVVSLPSRTALARSISQGEILFAIYGDPSGSVRTWADEEDWKSELQCALEEADPSLPSGKTLELAEYVGKLAVVGVQEGLRAATASTLLALGPVAAELAVVEHADAPHPRIVGLRTGVDQWGDRHGLGLSVESQFRLQVWTKSGEKCGSIVCDWCGSRSLQLEEDTVSSHSWASWTYLRRAPRALRAPAEGRFDLPNGADDNELMEGPKLTTSHAVPLPPMSTVWMCDVLGGCEPEPIPLTLASFESVVCISCSEKHAVVATSTGSVYTMGDGSEGALGHGDLRSLDKLKPITWFEDRRPRVRVSMVSAASDLTGCHTLCCGDEEGEIYAWGVAAACGRGTSSGYLPSPGPVERMAGKRAAAVSAGGGFGLVLTDDGAVWSFGWWARGRLGLGQPPDISRLRKRKRVPRFQLYPRKIEALPAVSSISTGRWHSLALTLEDGKIYSWGWGWCGQLGLGMAGGGHALGDEWNPRQVSGLPDKCTAIAAGYSHSIAIDSSGCAWEWGLNSMLPELGGGEERSVRARAEMWSSPRPVRGLAMVRVAGVSAGSACTAYHCSTGSSGGKSADEEEVVFLSIWGSVPREPSSAWMPELAGVLIPQVSVGGSRVLIVESGYAIRRSLGHLLRSAEESGDTQLIVGGGHLRAHRVVLSQRSTVLRDLIDAEGDTAPGEDLEILLPDLRLEVASALVRYLYTGTLDAAELIPTLPLAGDLLDAARSYGVKALELFLLSNNNPYAEADDAGISSLASDLGRILTGSSSWHSDVRFIAEGRPILANRALLACRSEYFAAMFGSGMRESSSSKQQDVVVPDSYAGLLRLLLWIYTGVLPAAGVQAALEDLIAADRYRLLGMKRLSQSMVQLTPETVTAALAAAELADAPLLRENALSMMRANLAEVPMLGSFLSENSHLCESLYMELRREEAGSMAAHLVRERQAAKKLVEEEAQQSLPGAGGPFPWIALVIAIVTAAAYSQMANIVAIGAAVPIINTVFIAGLLYWGYVRLRD
jgi:alpha-tubulin suppressor-like RCC1 family protein